MEPEECSLVQIKLTQKEKELFDFLIHFITTKNIPVTIRAAGGWVRDKILGKECDDIDFAIDNMSGDNFIQCFVNYLKETDQENLVSGIGVIKSNPDQSKHLQVATFKFFGYDIDIVNLRSDDFAGNTNTSHLFGTPLQDAQRRDLTINSMFYNLNLGIIEDFTTYGLNDLQNHIVRTPIDPVQTYADDPLRILRAIRFAVKYQFTIHSDILDAIKKQEIKDLLLKKVSRHRIRSELEKILIDKNVEYGIDLLYKNDLWSIVFLIQDREDKCENLKDIKIYNEKQEQSYILCKQVIQNLQSTLNTQSLTDQYNYKDAQLLILLSALTFPLVDLKYQKPKKIIPLPYYLTFESLFFPETVCQTAQHICECAVQIQNYDKQNEQQVFDSVAKLIKNQGQTWWFAFCIAQLYDSQYNKEKQQFYSQLLSFIHAQKLEKIYDMPQFIDGKEIMEIFKKKGPIIGTIKNNIFLWQAKNQNKGKDDLLKEIQENQDSFLV